MDPKFNDIQNSIANQIFKVVFFPDRIYHARYLSATRSSRYRYSVREVRSGAVLTAMKGQVFESPRGPILIDAQTRDIVQDVYIRRVERVDGQLYNMEFEKQTAVKDPVSN